MFSLSLSRLVLLSLRLQEGRRSPSLYNLIFYFLWIWRFIQIWLWVFCLQWTFAGKDRIHKGKCGRDNRWMVSTGSEAFQTVEIQWVCTFNVRKSACVSLLCASFPVVQTGIGTPYFKVWGRRRFSSTSGGMWQKTTSGCPNPNVCSIWALISQQIASCAFS